MSLCFRQDRQLSSKKLVMLLLMRFRIDINQIISQCDEDKIFTWKKNSVVLIKRPNTRIHDDYQTINGFRITDTLWWERPVTNGWGGGGGVGRVGGGGGGVGVVGVGWGLGGGGSPHPWPRNHFSRQAIAIIYIYVYIISWKRICFVTVICLCNALRAKYNAKFLTIYICLCINCYVVAYNICDRLMVQRISFHGFLWVIYTLFLCNICIFFRKQSSVQIRTFHRICNLSINAVNNATLLWIVYV